MSQEITKPQTSTAMLDAYRVGDLSAMEQQVRSVGADIPFANGWLQFNGKTGLFRVKDEIVSTGTLWAFLVSEARAEWVAWSDSKVHDRKSARMIEGGFSLLPTEAELDANEPCPIKNKAMDGWKPVIVFPVRDMEGEYGQLELTLTAKNNSKYPRPSWQLINEWLAYQKDHHSPEGTLYVPIVEIDVHEFPSAGGKSYAPILKVSEWLTMAELDEQSGDGEEIEQAAVAAPDPEPEAPAKEAPRFSRRGGRTA